MTGETVGGMVRVLIGCDWGSKITAEIDLGLCGVRAVQRMVLHDPGSGQMVVLQFCAHHLAMVEEMTNPHAA